MNWYYVDGGQQAGPVSDPELAALVQSGKVQADTLVWHEGMSNWQPYREVKPSELRLSTAPPVAVPGGGAIPGGAEAACVECGKVFPTSEMIQYGDTRVCANCKPIFVQKLAEGARVGQAMEYAGFWIRFVAIFMDGLLLWIANFVISLAAGLTAAQAIGVDSERLSPVRFVLFFVEIAIGAAYETFMVGKYGATLGKMACKLRVVTADGGRISYLRAFGRHFAKILSGCVCAIGYIMAAFDSEKRGLHDHICNTRVIRSQ
ncbi:MAG: RDD family protein [Verrucomicrobia bacterium]|nr:MAG: RDD family protein [Verrucomicrobiota bacterium]